MATTNFSPEKLIILISMDAHTFLKSENYRQKRSELTQTNFVNEHLTRELFSYQGNREPYLTELNTIAAFEDSINVKLQSIELIAIGQLSQNHSNKVAEVYMQMLSLSM